MAEILPCELVSWGMVYDLCRDLALSIRKSAFRPDIMVAIARGGYVPARILCDFLDISALASIRIVHYTAGAKKEKAARLVAPLNEDIRGLQVLLVDDVNDSGETLAVATGHLRALGPAALRVAVLQQKQVSPFIPDFFGAGIRTWRWIIYPWAVHEDIGGFLGRMEAGERPGSVQEAAAFFSRHYGIRVPNRVLEDIMIGPLRSAGGK